LNYKIHQRQEENHFALQIAGMYKVDV